MGRASSVARSGSAMVELAVLLPVYVLLLVGLIYFSNELMLWQESQQAARFLASNTRAAASAPSGTASPLIANTSGSLVPDDYFIFYSGGAMPKIALDSAPGEWSQAEMKAFLVKASWNVRQTFDQPTGTSALSQNLTGLGNVVYGNKEDLWKPEPGEYSYDGDDALIAEELSGWFTRRSATVTLTYDAKYIHVGKWKLPPPSVTAEGRAVVRTPADRQRSLTKSDAGYRRPIEDLVARFPSDEVPAGALSMPHYPDFMDSGGFWTPD